MGRYRDAWDQLKKFRHICSADLKKEAKRKADLEVEEKRLVELEEFRSKAKAEAIRIKRKLEADVRELSKNMSYSIGIFMGAFHFFTII